ncbi:hypothetical protein L1285_21370 [Pseudoalteromonas sp. DL2-H2.2]|uniref:RHS repeat-associated core domain-containing protein n=1 Tax=Pseudoalteromonas sp. DL2-H2.2 TaxID=2908889 RepID=UPI001F31786A|nr:hypothetical protein [Pseudoalteromonas sp. DL2-H2.2]
MTHDYDYDANGNLILKDGWVQEYGKAGKPLHAIASRSRVNPVTSQYEQETFGYDANGNQTSVDKNGSRYRDVVYSGRNKATRISGNGETVTFKYDASNRRYKRTDNEQTVYYVGALELTTTKSGGHKAIKRYVGNDVIQSYNAQGQGSHKWLFTNYQGSIVAITNSKFELLKRFKYDAFGKQSEVFGSDTERQIDFADSATLLGHLFGNVRGYTGHESLKLGDDNRVIHMNGRLYDSGTGRFMQADPFVQAPANLQNYNRFSYVLNNPMSYTDPSGYLFKKLKKAINSVFKAVNKALGDFAPLVSIGLGIWAPWGTGFWASIGTGALAGGIATGSLKGALTGAFTAGMFHGIGTHFQGLADSAGVLSTGAKIGKVLAHGLAGGISSVMSGGKFGHGFVSAGFTQAFSGVIDKIGGRIGNITSGSYFDTINRAKRIIASAVVGGTASSITGGKFVNGAITGAFSRGFNDEAHFQAQKPSFWGVFSERAMSGQVRDDLFTGLGAYAKGTAGLVGAAGGWLIRPFNPVVGGTMMVDGASTFLGAVSDLSNHYYGSNYDFDFVGHTFGDTAEFYGFDRVDGAKARAALSMTTMAGAWRTTVPRIAGSSSYKGWGTNQLEYSEYVYSIQTSSVVTATVDAYNARDAFKKLAPNN